MRKINDNNGYLTSNLHNFTPKKIINSNRITTDGMAFSIKANGVILHPNTGDYIFNTKQVIEKPLNNKEMNYYQQGGMQPEMQQQAPQQGQQGQAEQIMQLVAQALQQGTPPEQIVQMLVQQGIPQEQAQQMVQQVAAQMQGGQEAPQEQMQDQGQEMPQEGQEQPQMQVGGMMQYLKPYSKLQPKYNSPKMDWVDSSNYRRNFNNTLNLSQTPYDVNYSPSKNKLDYTINESIPYIIRNTQDNPGVRDMVIKEEDAYADYKNQFYNTTKNIANKNPQVKNFLNKMTPFKWQQGGNFNPNGYDAIHPSMYNQMQNIRDNGFPQQYPSQEDIAFKMIEDRQAEQMGQAKHIARQRQKMAKQVLSPGQYDYISKNPQASKLINPYTINANMNRGSFQEGGMTDAEAKILYKNPRYVQSAIDAETRPFIGPPEYRQPMTELATQYIPDENAVNAPSEMTPAMASVMANEGNPVYITKRKSLSKGSSSKKTNTNSNRDNSKANTYGDQRLSHDNVRDWFTGSERQVPIVKSTNPTSILDTIKQNNVINNTSKSVSKSAAKDNSSNFLEGLAAAGVLGTSVTGAATYNYLKNNPEVMKNITKNINIYRERYGTDLTMKDIQQLVKDHVGTAKRVMSDIKMPKVQYPSNYMTPKEFITDVKGNVRIPKLNVSNLPEKIGSKLYEYPKFRPAVNMADKLYKNVSKTTEKLIKRIK